MADLFPFVSEFRNDKPALRRRMGTIQSVQSDYTLTVTLNGTDIPGVRYFGHYLPVAGQQVWLDTDGGDLVAIGSIAGRGGKFLGCYVYKTAGGSQNIADNTLEKITFGVADYNIEGMFDNPNDLVTLNRSGLWHVQGGIFFASNATGYREINLRSTGSIGPELAVQRVSASPSAATRLTVATIRNFTYGDTVSMYGRQTSGSPLQVTGDGNPETTWLSAVYIGPGA